MTHTELQNIIAGHYYGKIKNIIESSNEIQSFVMLTYPKYSSIKELVYLIKNNIFKLPSCPVCGKPLKFIESHNRYQHHCSRSCASKDIEALSKKEQTCLAKYGVKSFVNPKKRAKTCLMKYGVESALTSLDVRHKITETKLIKHGDINYNNSEKRKSTCLERYGYENAASNSDVRNKMKITNVARHGAENYLAAPEFKQYRNNKKAQERIYATKQRNGTFNTSIMENDVYDILKTRFPDVKRSYKSLEYPFNCDFYIQSEKLYIECNFHWTHGSRPYTGSDEDIAQLLKWQAKNTKFYMNAIKTWTVRDVKKRETAKNNNLRYIEFFSFDEFIQWFNKHFNEGVSTIPDECKGVEPEISTGSKRQTTNLIC